MIWETTPFSKHSKGIFFSGEKKDGSLLGAIGYKYIQRACWLEKNGGH